jgi:signal transduction histidine kinase
VWYLLLLYGAAFVLLGGVLVLQARSPVRVLPGLSLWSLSAFGYLHGAREWTLLALLHEGPARALVLAHDILLPISFAALLQFGVEVEVAHQRWPRWSRSVPLLLLVLQGLVLLVLPAKDARPLFEAMVRYTAALPGALLAAAALLRERAGIPTERSRMRRYLALAATAFAIYAIASGLLVGEAPLPVASFLNAEAFRKVTGVPVELVRAACAAVIGVSLGEAFVIESARAHAEAERMREEFLSVVAHDLRAPLGAIDLLAARLERIANEHPDQAKAVVERIRERIRRLGRMVEDLLDASRIEAKRLLLRRERLDLAKVVSDFVDQPETVTQGHRIELLIGEGRADVEVDLVRLEQVFLNLLSNAGKYSFPNTPIKVQVTPRHDEVRVSVTSTGPSIPAEARPHLFDRFYRAKAAAQGSMPGVGLGLYLARGLVEAHGGRIWIEPPRGDVTTFTFAIPIAPR